MYVISEKLFERHSFLCSTKCTYTKCNVALIKINAPSKWKRTNEGGGGGRRGGRKKKNKKTSNTDNAVMDSVGGRERVGKKIKEET